MPLIFSRVKVQEIYSPKNSICTALGGTTTACTLADANIALQEAIAICDISYEKYEKQVNRKGFWKSAIGIAGTFASSVGVPISSGDVALGLGGFAGATNAKWMCKTWFQLQ